MFFELGFLCLLMFALFPTRSQLLFLHLLLYIISFFLWVLLRFSLLSLVLSNLNFNVPECSFSSIFVLLGIFDGYSFHRLGHISVSIFQTVYPFPSFLSFHDIPVTHLYGYLMKSHCSIYSILCFVPDTVYLIWFDSFHILYDSLITLILSFNFLKQREYICVCMHVCALLISLS